MEERGHHSPSNHHYADYDDEPVSEDHIHPEEDHIHNDDHMDETTLPSETYVVQVPKDQIYRVPPPENALLAEQYKKPATGRNKRSGYCCCGNRFSYVIAVVIIILIIGIALVAGLSYHFLEAKDPIFHVESFLVKNVSGGQEFDVGLKTKNPNMYSDVLYEEGGQSSLSFKQKKVASGGFPTFLHDKESTVDVRITLRNTGGTLPAEIKRQMSSKKAVPLLSFTLKVMFTAKLKKGFFQRYDVDLAVSCDYQVNRLTGGTNILSEECLTKHS
ncbi:hypothetical protein MLD38_034783 [Melastoma candidum]|uniref:Uncharacterized protein n=1 Tax=Melastoma candidum TaxID=119954 RepID=A0ACB9MDH4_9MYRT|nr:hypothetical protein MLD38_034783 [Melastoma candidum]